MNSFYQALTYFSGITMCQAGHIEYCINEFLETYLIALAIFATILTICLVLIKIYVKRKKMIIALLIIFITLFCFMAYVKIAEGTRDIRQKQFLEDNHLAI